MTERNPQLEDRRVRYARQLNALFSAALSASSYETICSLLRVGTLSDGNWDPFEESRAGFDDYNWALEKVSAERGQTAARRVGLLMYCQAVEMTAPHEILANLLRCAAGETYVIDPFSDLARSKTGVLFSRVPPSAKQKFRRIGELASAVGQEGLFASIQKVFDDRVRNAFSHSDYVLTDDFFRFFAGGLAQQVDVETLDTLIAGCFDFYGVFMGLHREWLRSLGQAKRFHKWPNYEVLELLVSDEDGLYGFHVHFSNGSRATCSRRKRGTEATNVTFSADGGIDFMVGCVDDLEPVWKIDGKPVGDWDAMP